MNEQITQRKADLRKTLQALMDSLPEAYIAQSDTGIERNLLTLSAWQAAHTVFIYVSTGREPQTRGMIQAALRAGKTVAVPRVLGGGWMEARVISSMDDLLPGMYGIPEPGAGAPLLLPQNIDLIVVPCIAADRQGYRLGHGGGYYDRYLADFRGTTVCLCRERLLQDALPHNALDVRLDDVITEQQSVSFR